MFIFKPTGVCSAEIQLEIINGKIESVEFLGGCSGNLQGIGKLVKGKDALEMMELLKGIKCGYKNTSCPDQLSIAISRALRLETVK